ncbi:MAG: right-handed parallel beta-helix repeat-containing protein [Planctomycetaceae bacterium]|nr:right-handed parallel beta-helix repeat-containing protein [Planctomycetaceae bacterium]
MRASFAAIPLIILAVVTGTASRAIAEYPYALPENPSFDGIYSRGNSGASMMSFDPDLVIPGDYGNGTQGEYLPDQYPLDGFDGDIGPADYPIDDPIPGFETVFANGAPIWIGHIASSYMISSERSLWNGELFLPLWQDGRNFWFFNTRGQVDDESAGEFNIGTGFRTMAWPGWIFGTYLFYDRLDSSNDNGFSQATLGVEAMDVFWDFRFNVYFPESKAKLVSTPPAATISNGTILVTSGVERAYWGVDVETGALLWSWGPNAEHELRGFVGLYHFDHSEPGFDNITGPRARMEWRVYDLPYFGNGSRFTWGFSVQADTERGGDASVFAGLRIPLDPWANARRPLSQLQRRMLDSVVRDVDVVTNAVGQSESAINTLTENRIESVRVLQQGDDISKLVEEAGEDSVVVVDGSEGEIYSGEPINLQTGQLVMGGGMKLSVVGERTGLPATFTAPGARPKIEFGSLSNPYHTSPPGFVMADHTFLKGVDIRSGGPAVSVNHADHVTIDDVYIRDADGAGIAIQGANHVEVNHVTIDEVDGSNWNKSAGYETAAVSQGAGVVAIDSRNVMIHNSTIRETAGPGISLHDTEEVSISGIDLDNTGSDNYESYGSFGIWGNRTVNTRIDEVDIDGVGGGIFLWNAAGTAKITNSTIKGEPSELGIGIRKSSGDPLDLIISDNTIGQRGLKLRTDNDAHMTARVTGNDIGGNGSSVDIVSSGTGTTNIGLFDNTMDGTLEVDTSDQRVLNLVLQDNTLLPGTTTHSILSRDDASTYLLYGGNMSPSDVLFENNAAFFSLEPFIGNDHSPMLQGTFNNLPIGTLRSRAPTLFD